MTTPKVLPSGGALATASVPMMPLAPGLLSISTVWPSRSCSFWPISRAVTSVKPPGG